MFSMNSPLEPVYFVLAGPFKIFDAFVLSAYNEDRQRANTDSPIRVTGIPKSKDSIAVHLPVPFCFYLLRNHLDRKHTNFTIFYVTCPAVSLILGNKCSPFSL